jgi:hypothetical protein
MGNKCFLRRLLTIDISRARALIPHLRKLGSFCLKTYLECHHFHFGDLVMTPDVIRGRANRLQSETLFFAGNRRA